jgi:hypothetical protein
VNKNQLLEKIEIFHFLFQANFEPGGRQIARGDSGAVVCTPMGDWRIFH